MSDQPSPLTGGGATVDQLGILVSDLDAAIAAYGQFFSGPWSVYTYGPDTVPVLTYRGHPGSFAMRLALSASTPQIELIEPLAGPSIYEESIAAHGHGLHHVGVMVPSIEVATRSMVAAGYELLQTGSGYGLDGDGGFAYFDTTAELGIIVEAIGVPRRRRPPELVVP